MWELYLVYSEAGFRSAGLDKSTSVGICPLTGADDLFLQMSDFAAAVSQTCVTFPDR